MPLPTKRLSPLTNPTGVAVQARSSSDASGPGFYQGLVGRKTGRAAPRSGGHGRTLPRHEAILAEHGLMEKGAADPNQGQLFAPPEMPSVESPRESAKRTGTPPPLASSRPGFMPELYERQTAAGEVVHATTAEAHKSMIRAINRVPAYELHEGVRLGSANERAEHAGHRLALGVQGPQVVAPIAEAMRQRQATRALHRGDAPWYAERQETSEGYTLGPGSATEMVTNASARQGISYEQMSRATAITSPQTAWTLGTPGTSDYAQPNVESAENVIHGVKAAQTSANVSDRSVNYGEVGAMAQGRALGEMKAKAGADFAHSDPSQPIPIAELQSQKVPNFNQSLLLAHPSQSVRRQAALSYTVDMHDVASQNSHADLLKTPGGYAISRMAGRRVAMKNRELGPMSQSGVWMGQKSKEAEPVGQHSLFQETRGGKIRANPKALPGHVVVDNRSETAKRMGIEF